MIKKILVPTDGSEGALLAARVAGEIARKFDARLLVIYVMIPIPAMNKLAENAGESLLWAGSAAGVRGLEQGALDIIRRTARVLEEAGIQYEYRLERGHPGVRIGEVAVEEDMDLVVIGEQGANRAKGLDWGKVSEQVTRSASCSVMIVE